MKIIEESERFLIIKFEADERLAPVLTQSINSGWKIANVETAVPPALLDGAKTVYLWRPRAPFFGRTSGPPG